jgi:hypothetical protein
MPATALLQGIIENQRFGLAARWAISGSRSIQRLGLHQIGLRCISIAQVWVIRSFQKHVRSNNNGDHVPWSYEMDKHRKLNGTDRWASAPGLSYPICSAISGLLLRCPLEALTCLLTRVGVGVGRVLDRERR